MGALKHLRLQRRVGGRCVLTLAIYDLQRQRQRASTP